MQVFIEIPLLYLGAVKWGAEVHVPIAIRYHTFSVCVVEYGLNITAYDKAVDVEKQISNENTLGEPISHCAIFFLQKIACSGGSYSVMSMRDIGKPPVRGKTSPYGFFVKMCYEEHKKKYPNENVQVTEISKKCSEKWKVKLFTMLYSLFYLHVP